MKYVDVIDSSNKKRHIGLALSYYKTRTPKITLFEDGKQFATLTSEVFQFELSSINHGFVSNTDFYKQILEAANIRILGTYKSFFRCDFTKLVELTDKLYGIDLIKPGMIEISECITISSKLVFYILHKKVDKDDVYTLYTKDKHKYVMSKDYVIKAHVEYHVPIFNRVRQGV